MTLRARGRRRQREAGPAQVVPMASATAATPMAPAVPMASMTSTPAYKACPRCGEPLFADMDRCYECLYDFTNPGLDYSGSGAPFDPLGSAEPAEPMGDGCVQGAAEFDAGYEGDGFDGTGIDSNYGNAQAAEPSFDYGVESVYEDGADSDWMVGVPDQLAIPTEALSDVQGEVAAGEPPAHMPLDARHGETPYRPLGTSGTGDSQGADKASGADKAVGTDEVEGDPGGREASEAVEVNGVVRTDDSAGLGQDAGLFAEPSESPDRDTSIQDASSKVDGQSKDERGDEVQLGVLVRWRGLEMAVPLEDRILGIGRDRANDIAIASFDVPAFAVEIEPDGDGALLRLLADGVVATLDDEPFERETRMGAGQEVALFGARLSLVRVDD